MSDIRRTKMYHSRNLAHDSQLMTEAPSSTILHIARKVNTRPVADSATINHFLPRKRTKTRLSNQTTNREHADRGRQNVENRCYLDKSMSMAHHNLKD